MSTGSAEDVEVAVVGAGVVGSAVALALCRRGVAVAVLEAEPEPALAASATNSGILHAAFDSGTGELETELLLRSAALRADVISALGVAVLDCGGLLRARDASERDALAALAANAARNGVAAMLEAQDTLVVPGEAVTDPVAFTLALLGSAQTLGAEVHTGFRVVAIERSSEALTLVAQSGERARSRVAVNCAGLGADAVARLVDDDSFEIYPRKGEFLVFDREGMPPLERILLPVPSKRTKGVLVFPTVDGMVVAGPTAVDQQDKDDWSVRPEARAEILAKASALWPPLAESEPVFSYAGLRPAGRGVNYLIGTSRACNRLLNVAAIRSTGLSASLGIAERVVEMVAGMGIRLGKARGLEALLERGSGAVPREPWWRRVADFRAR